MALAPGTRIGPFEIVGSLGAGGMGEVYRARDTKLNRDVAIKILLPSTGDDPDRLTRFGREAQALAALNHPNIAAIYGLEEAPALGLAGAIVMEYVEGPTLAERLAPFDSGSERPGRSRRAQAGLPLDEAVTIARQVIDALEAAHDAGIVHRDLKPANIKIRADGTVKVLDFGLAKALDSTSGPVANATNSPTLTARATQAGVILGTAAYMAPEQARGRAVDRRADIWAFGVVFYEMLTGRRLFQGDDISITLAAVLKDEVDWAALPADLPSPIRRLLRRCLERDPNRRLSAIGDARLELIDAADPALQAREAGALGPPVASRAKRGATPWLIAAASLTAAALMLARWAPWRAPEPAPTVTFEVPTEFATVFLALSPDGRYLASRTSGENRLWLRSLDRLSADTLPGTEGTTAPFWSADSRRIGFFADRKLKIVGLDGAPPVAIADAPGGRGGTWNRAGTILFAPDANAPLYRVSAAGGEATEVTTLDQARGDTAHAFPTFLPDDDHFVFLVTGATTQETGIYIGSLNAPGTKRLVHSEHRPTFAPPDVLLYLRGSTLMAQRLDMRRLEPVGDAVPVADPVASLRDLVAMSASHTGMLAYRTGGPGGVRRMAWVDRTGKVEQTIDAPGLHESPRLSPDGRQLVFTRGGDLFLHDIDRGTSSRFTFDAGRDTDPVWSPDGTRVAFASDRDGGVFNLYVKSAGGTGADQLLLKTPNHKSPSDWSPGGLVYAEGDGPQRDLWVLPMTGDRQPQRVVDAPSAQGGAAFSPDSRFLAYHSSEAALGRTEVYVQDFPAGGRRWQISTLGGANPRWRPDGQEMYYDSFNGLMAVDLTGTQPGALKAGVPRELFKGLVLGIGNYDVARNGQRFVIVSDVADRPAPIVVVMNWQNGLRP